MENFTEKPQKYDERNLNTPSARRANRLSDHFSDKPSSFPRRGFNNQNGMTSVSTSSTPLVGLSPLRRSQTSFAKSHQKFMQARVDRDKLHSPPTNHVQLAARRHDRDDDSSDGEELDMLVNSTMDAIDESFDNDAFSKPYLQQQRHITVPKSASSRQSVNINITPIQHSIKRNSLTSDMHEDTTFSFTNDSQMGGTLYGKDPSIPFSAMGKSSNLWDDLESVKERLRRMKISQGISLQKREGSTLSSSLNSTNPEMHHPQPQASTVGSNNYNSLYPNSRSNHKPANVSNSSSQTKKQPTWMLRPAERHLREVLESLKRIRITVSNSSNDANNKVNDIRSAADSESRMSSSGPALLMCMLEHSAADLLAIYHTISPVEELVMGTMDDTSQQLESTDKAALSLAGFILQFLDSHKLSSLHEQQRMPQSNLNNPNEHLAQNDDSQMLNQFHSQGHQQEQQLQNQSGLGQHEKALSPQLANLNSFSSFGITAAQLPVASSSSRSSVNSNISNSLSSVSESHNQASMSTNSTLHSSSTNMAFHSHFSNQSPKAAILQTPKTRSRLSGNGTGHLSRSSSNGKSHGYGFRKPSPSYHASLVDTPSRHHRSSSVLENDNFSGGFVVDESDETNELDPTFSPGSSSNYANVNNGANSNILQDHGMNNINNSQQYSRQPYIFHKKTTSSASSTPLQGAINPGESYTFFTRLNNGSQKDRIDRTDMNEKGDDQMAERIDRQDRRRTSQSPLMPDSRQSSKYGKNI